MPSIAAPASSPLSTRPLNDSEPEVNASATTQEPSDDENRTARGIFYAMLLSCLIWIGVVFGALLFH